MALRSIPDDFGAGGANIEPHGAEPSLRTLFREHKAAIETIQDTIPDTTSQLRTSWYVDEVAGDDSGDGSVGQPLATVAEIVRRASGGTVLTDATIHVVSNGGFLSDAQARMVDVLTQGARQWAMA